MTDQCTQERFEAMKRRYDAAENLERARQVIRETSRYGYPVTQQHHQAVYEAEFAYNCETRRWSAIDDTEVAFALRQRRSA